MLIATAPIERKTELDARAGTMLLACCAIWGMQSILIKAVSHEVPPFLQAALRMGGAAMLVWAGCRWRGVTLFGRDGTLFGGLLAGALFTAEFACLYAGLQYTAASRITVFAYTAPFWVALLMPRVTVGERLRGPQWAGLGLAFAAVALAFSENFFDPVGLSDQDATARLLGDSLGLIAGLTWALTTVTIRASALQHAGADKLLFYQVGAAGAVLPLLSLAAGESWRFDYSSWVWATLAAQSVLGAFISSLAWMWMLRRYPATRLSSFTFLTPLFTLVFGVALLGEPLTWRLVAALAGVAAGIVLVNRRG